MTDARNAESQPRTGSTWARTHPDYAWRLEEATQADEHFSVLLEGHASRLVAMDRCLVRFRESVEAFRKHQDGRIVAAVEETHNELCIVEELLTGTVRCARVTARPNYDLRLDRMQVSAAPNPSVRMTAVDGSGTEVTAPAMKARVGEQFMHSHEPPPPMVPTNRSSGTVPPEFVKGDVKLKYMYLSPPCFLKCTCSALLNTEGKGS
jgi:hypothetical protein